MHTGAPSPTSTRRTVAAPLPAGVAAFLVLYEPQGLLPAIREAYGIDGPTASLTVSATNVAMAVFLIPFSMLAGRIGHARQIGAGVIVAAILALILPFTPTPELLIAVRFLQGVAIASVPATAMAYLSLRLPSQALPGAIGVYIAGNTIGGLCSRLLTGLAAELLGWHGGLAFTAAVSLVFGLIVVWLLRHDLFSTSRSRSAREVVPTGAEAADPVGQEPAEARPPRRMIPLRGGLWRIYLTGFLCMIVFGGSFTMLGTRLQHDPWRLSRGAGGSGGSGAGRGSAASANDSAARGSVAVLPPRIPVHDRLRRFLHHARRPPAARPVAAERGCGRTVLPHLPRRHRRDHLLRSSGHEVPAHPDHACRHGRRARRCGPDADRFAAGHHRRHVAADRRLLPRPHRRVRGRQRLAPR